MYSGWSIPRIFGGGAHVGSRSRWFLFVSVLVSLVIPMDAMFSQAALAVPAAQAAQTALGDQVAELAVGYGLNLLDGLTVPVVKKRSRESNFPWTAALTSVVPLLCGLYCNERGEMNRLSVVKIFRALATAEGLSATDVGLFTKSTLSNKITNMKNTKTVDAMTEELTLLAQLKGYNNLFDLISSNGKRFASGCYC
jgi:hypothetical protein